MNTQQQQQQQVRRQVAVALLSLSFVLMIGLVAHIWRKGQNKIVLAKYFPQSIVEKLFADGT